MSKDKDHIIDNKQGLLKTDQAPFEFEIQDNFVGNSEKKERTTPTKKEILDTNIECEQNFQMNNTLEKHAPVLFTKRTH